MLVFIFGAFCGAALSAGNLGAAFAFVLIAAVAHAATTDWRPWPWR